MPHLGDRLRQYRRSKGLNQEEMAMLIGIGVRTYQDIEKTGKVAKMDVIEKIRTKLGVDTLFFADSEDEMDETKRGNFIESRKLKKISADLDNDGILYVPIAAQAGYSNRFLDPVYLNQLEKVHLPGFPYRGTRYRVFDVKGDSMEPTYKEGYHLVCEQVDPDSWHQISNFYVYVVVLQNDIIVKRLFRKDDRHFVAISDNEEFHPQFLVKISEIKELWLVKRKIDWEMAPPKKFEIKV